MIALRDYQQRGIERTLRSIAAGKRAPLLVSPTGTGKMVEKLHQNVINSQISDAPAVLVTPRSVAPSGRDKMNSNTRRCARCDEVKTLDLFPRDRHEPSGYSYSCKACKAAYRRARRAADPVAARERERAYEARIAEQTKARKAAYYVENKERILARHAANRPTRLAQMSAYGKANRTAINARRKVYRAANPEQFRAYFHKTRAQRRAAPGKHTGKDIKKQFAAQKGRCWWCRCKLTEYQVDHLIPLSRGGSNGPENIVIACRPCNQSRNNKLPHEWTERLL